MSDAFSIDRRRAGEAALDDIAIAPPATGETTPATTEVREAKDAGHHEELRRDPTHADSKLEIALDESFPTSDSPANSLPGSADPAPSSGFDEVAEAEIARDREHAK
jgi:hypothetical protein